MSRARIRSAVQWLPVALYPLAVLVVTNRASGIRPVDLLICLAAVLALTLAASEAAAAIAPPSRTDVRDIVSLMLVVFLFYFGHGARALEVLTSARTQSVVLDFLIWSCVAGIALILILRVRRSLAAVVPPARVFGVALLATAIVSGALNARRETLAATRPVEREGTSRSAAGAPDIYLIVVDKYSASRALRANYGYDNGWVETELRRRGFFVPRAARSNYVYTSLSLASMLDMRLLQEDPIAGLRGNDARLAAYAKIRQNRVAAVLERLGYEFVFFPSTWVGTSRAPLADRVVAPPRSAGIGLVEAWVAGTVLGPLGSLARAIAGREEIVMPIAAESAGELDWKLRQLPGIAGSSGPPKFVFVHLLLPHEPYVYGERCEPQPPYWPRSDQGASRPRWHAAYVRAVRCLNVRLVTVVDSLLARSSRPPIIIIQADHGHGGITSDALFGKFVPLRRLPVSSILERTSVFAAYYLPDGGNAVLYDSITPVNVFPLVLDHYFGTAIPTQPDRTYWSEFADPFQFTEITLRP